MTNRKIVGTLAVVLAALKMRDSFKRQEMVSMASVAGTGSLHRAADFNHLDVQTFAS